ncbi:hypothetical protein F183_A24300 [Bryobacterales bacterium F-183]|nr:hypothetical protein F183_A24300 [Bryobacterales bacterium F-183]
MIDIFPEHLLLLIVANLVITDIPSATNRNSNQASISGLSHVPRALCPIKGSGTHGALDNRGVEYGALRKYTFSSYEQQDD